MKRLSLLALLVFVLALGLVACGGGTTETPVATDVPAGDTATEEPAMEATDEPVGETSMECTDAIGCVEIAPGDPILLASALVISGPNIELGTDSQHGVEIAIAMRPEVLGHPVELLSCRRKTMAVAPKAARRPVRRSSPTRRSSASSAPAAPAVACPCPPSSPKRAI